VVALQQDLVAAAAAHQLVAEILEARPAGIGAEQQGGSEENGGDL
jgi:hypothetical protein